MSIDLAPTHIGSPTLNLIGITVNLTGNANHEIDRTTAKLNAAHGAMVSYTSGLQHMFDSVVSSIARVGLALGSLGVAGALHSVVSSIHEVNNDLEKTQIAISDTFRRFHYGRDFQDAMRMSKEMMSKMFADAAKLPGEFKDLIFIYRQISTGAFPLGMKPMEVEKLAAQFMAFGSSKGIPMDQVAREGLMLLQGRTQQNILGIDLGFQGDRARELVGAQGPARAKLISDEMAKHNEAMDAYATSFEALWSNIAMDYRAFKGWMTEGLFGDIKKSLSWFSDWFEANKETVKAWATTIGEWLHDAFNKAVEVLRFIWPDLEANARSLRSHIEGLMDRFLPKITHTTEQLSEIMGDFKSMKEYLQTPWEQINPMLKAIERLMEFFREHDVWQKLENIARLWLKVKMMDMAESVSNMVGGGDTLKWGLIGQISNLTDPNSPNHDHAWKQLSETMTKLEQLSILKERELDMDMRQSEWLGTVEHGAANTMLDAAIRMKEASLMLKDKVTPDRDRHPVEGDEYLMVEDPFTGKMTRVPWIGPRTFDHVGTMGGATIPIHPSTLGNLNGPQNKDVPTPPSAGTNIQKVEIVVNTSDEPSRVARVIHNYLADLSRLPKASPDARNFTSSR